MPSYFLIALGCFIALYSQPSFAEDRELQGKISEIVRQTAGNNGEGAAVFWDLEKDEPIVSVNADTPLIPASNTKVATAVSSLKLLGLLYEFKTRFYADGPIDENGVLNGDLYVRGSGDPSITVDAMWLIASSLSDMGITRITGNIYGDDTIFDNQLRPVGWTPHDGSKPYVSLISGLSFNYNCIEVTVKPDKSKEKVIVTTEPALPSLEIVNEMHIGKSGNMRVSTNQEKDAQRFVFSGTLGANDAPTIYYQTVQYPAQFFLSSLQGALESKGISIGGRIGLQTVPSKAVLIHEHRSKPLALILRDMDKFSSNFIANHLIKTLAAQYVGKPASFADGVKVMTDFYAQQGVDMSNVHLVDGSGLSAANRMTARFLVDAHRVAYKDLAIFPEIISSLAIVGVDGSTARWKISDRMRGKIRVKTGTISRAVSLSGYLQTENGKLVLFAMIFNDAPRGIGSAREAERKILDTVFTRY